MNPKRCIFLVIETSGKKKGNFFLKEAASSNTNVKNCLPNPPNILVRATDIVLFFTHIFQC